MVRELSGIGLSEEIYKESTRQFGRIFIVQSGSGGTGLPPGRRMRVEIFPDFLPTPVANNDAVRFVGVAIGVEVSDQTPRVPERLGILGVLGPELGQPSICQDRQ